MMDFAIIWQGLTAFLHTGNAYGYFYYYPPTFTLLLSPLGMIPALAGHLLLVALGLVVMLAVHGRRLLYWVAFMPLLYCLLVGQVDLLLIGLLLWAGTSRKGVLVAALVTVKPQIAVLVLPVYLARLLRENPGLLKWWLLSVVALWGGTALLVPGQMIQWIQMLLSGELGHAAPTSPGLWAVLPGIPALCLSIVLGVLAFRQREEGVQRAVMILISPFGLFYSQVSLIETAPWWLMVPVGFVSFFLMEKTASTVPALLVSLTPLAYQIAKRFVVPFRRYEEPIVENYG
jgi:hypothetical protein